MATDGLDPAQWALLAIESGWSATTGLDRFRAEGGHITSQVWYRMSAEIRTALGDRVGTYNEPLNRVPTPDEVKRWTTTRARGFIQQVEILVKDKQSGQVLSLPFSFQTLILRARNWVVKHALGLYSGQDESRYPHKIIGAVYTGTYRMGPDGE